MVNPLFRSIFSKERAVAALLAGGVLLVFSLLTIPSISSAGGVGYLQLCSGLLLVLLGTSELLSEEYQRSFALLRILTLALVVLGIYLLIGIFRFWLGMQ
ncbi:hypothetical protein [Haloparvum sp. AD34]